MTAQESSELITWINAKLNELGWSQNELARRSGLKSGVVSHVMTGTKPGVKVCRAIAAGFGVSPDQVLVLAGHLPKPPGYSPMRQEWKGLIDDLPDEQVQKLLAVARTMRDQESQQSKSKRRVSNE